MKRNAVLLIGLFGLTRLFVWVFRPLAFSEITYSYMPYAHLWASGVKPYLEQWYEYPPATIPLFYLPHLIDMFSYGKAFALNYLQAYRGMLLLIDIGVFSIIWKGLRAYKVREQVFVIGLVYYSLVTAKAHHFLYDTMDITFAAAMLVGVAAPLLLRSNAGMFGQWLGFFAATALKYVNAPLGLVYAVLQRRRWKQAIPIMLLAGAIVWLVPLGYFRSSLSVSLVYHRMRGIQVESTPAVIASSIDAFTDSEEFIEAYKNYEITGPVSEVLENVFDILLPLSILVYILGAGYIAWNAQKGQEQFLTHTLTLLYVFVFMVFATVLSTPFLLWHIPLVAMMPFSTPRQQLPFVLISGLIVLTSMSPIPNLPIGIFVLHQFIGWIRVIGFGVMLVLLSVQIFRVVYAKK